MASDGAGRPALIAHRGFLGENPENTVAAVRAATHGEGSIATGGEAPTAPGSETRGAAGSRADVVEIDAVPTADGDVVAFHPADLAGRRVEDGGRPLTDATGLVWEADTPTITAAEVLRSGERVPLLSTMLDAVPADVGVNIELKNPGYPDPRPGEPLDETALADRKAIWRPFVDRVVDLVADRDNEILLSSFFEAGLATLRERATHPVAVLFDDSIADGLTLADRYDAAAVHPRVEMIRGTPFFDGSRFADIDLVAAAHERDRLVNAWTVTTWYQAERVAAAGVDGVIADYSTVLRRSAD